MAAEVAAGLARLGFRVVVAGRNPGAASGPERLETIEKAPDFVLLSSASQPGPGGAHADVRAADPRPRLQDQAQHCRAADPADADPLASAEPSRASQAGGVAAGSSTTLLAAASRSPFVGHRLVSSSEVERPPSHAEAKARVCHPRDRPSRRPPSLRIVPAAVSYWNRPKAPPPLPAHALLDGRRAAHGERPADRLLYH